MTSSYSYSQVGYPQQILYKGDTVVAITRHQMMMLNQAHVSWEECVETNDSFFLLLDSCSKAFELLHDQLSNQQQMIAIRDISITNRKALISTQDSLIGDQKKVIKRLKVHKGLLATLDAILVGVIGYLAIFH